MAWSPKELVLGVIRDAKLYRANNAARAQADAEYRLLRPGALQRQGHRCAFCGYGSEKHIECHHLDGNHANNSDANLVAADALCHAYHHIGQRASQDRFATDNLGDKTLMAAIPEVSGADLNLLQRAVGAALLTPGSKETATKIMKALASRCEPVNEAFSSGKVGDMAAALAQLNDESYAARAVVIGELRLIFRMDVLENEGRKFLKDFSGLPVSSWPDLEAAAHARNQ